MFRKKKSKLDEAGESASSVMHELADSGADLLDEALAIVTPLVAQASEKAIQLRDLAMHELPPLAEQAKEMASPHLAQASERLTPVAATAKERLAPALATAKEQLGPAATKARERVAPAAASAVEHLAPLAATAIDRSADLAQQARTQLGPHVHEAIDRAQPHLEHARQRVQEDLVPHLTELLHQAAEHPAVAEASTRGTAALAALRGDVEVRGSHVVSRRRNRLATVAKVMAAGALLAAAAVAVRQFLASKDEGWQAHEPAGTATAGSGGTRDSGTVPPAPAAATPGNTTVPEPVSVHGAAGGATDEDTSIDSDQATSVEAGEARMIAEGGPVVDLEDDDDDDDVADEASAPAAGSYGPGSYVGDQPPAGFAIKGNERSMKYHVPGSGGYERTIADVWFENEEAAQAGGFTRAQR